MSSKKQSEAEYLNPETITFFRKDELLHVTIQNEQSWLGIKPYLLFPISWRNQFISLRDQNGDEIGIIQAPGNLAPQNLEILQSVIRARYFTPRITKIHSLSEKFGIVKWDVETDHGSKQFLSKSIYSSLTDTPDGYIITDLENNRYELIQMEQMDAKSRAILDKKI